jgi:serine/threonine-protein kinase
MLSAVRRARAALGSADTAIVHLDDAPTLITTLPATPPPPDPKPAKPQKQPRQRHPRPGRRRRNLIVAAIAALVLLVAGVSGWWLGTGRFAQAPSVLGVNAAAATARLRAAGLEVRTGAARNSDDVAAGLVADQDPDGGSRLKRGAVVTIYLSLGVKMSTVPDVRNATEKDARTALRSADLSVGKVTRRYDDTVPKDKVIGSAPAPGTRLKHDSAVSLAVSDGPAPVAVPDVAGQPLDKAIKALRDAGLTVTTTLEFSDTVEKDHVIAQTPVPGTSVAKGSTVRLRASKGPQTVKVPDVRGRDVDDAKAQLVALGLRPEVRHVRGGRGRVVLDQDPSPGTTVRIGTTVTLVLF